MHDDIRAALLNHDFEAAHNLIELWGESVRQRISSADEQARQSIFEEAIAQANDNLHLTRVLRSHISLELQDNSVPFLYSDAETERHCWHLNA
jgi:hypothetical protein